MATTPFLHPEHGPLHLGRPKVSPRNRKTMAKAFAMHDFLARLPVAPKEFDNTGGRKDWGMMLNDREGDCTCATCGHMIQVWTAASGKEVTIPDSAVEEAYEKACGYNPADSSTDQGGIITDVLDYFRDTGIGGYKIQAWAEVNLTQFRMQQAVSTFGLMDIGISLPLTAQDHIGGLWDIVNYAQDWDAKPGSWGGHSAPIVKYDPTGLWCVTWGLLQKMTWRFFMYYADEGLAIISPDYNKYPLPVSDLADGLHQVGT